MTVIRFDDDLSVVVQDSDFDLVFGLFRIIMGNVLWKSNNEFQTGAVFRWTGCGFWERKKKPAESK